MCIEFLSEHPKGRDHSENLGVAERLILVMDLKLVGCGVDTSGS
jgi:hypothetical protein